MELSVKTNSHLIDWPCSI